MGPKIIKLAWVTATVVLLVAAQNLVGASAQKPPHTTYVAGKVIGDPLGGIHGHEPNVLIFTQDEENKRGAHLISVIDQVVATAKASLQAEIKKSDAEIKADLLQAIRKLGEESTVSEERLSRLKASVIAELARDSFPRLEQEIRLRVKAELLVNKEFRESIKRELLEEIRKDRR